jgi:hypothetical protein
MQSQLCLGCEHAVGMSLPLHPVTPWLVSIKLTEKPVGFEVLKQFKNRNSPALLVTLLASIVPRSRFPAAISHFQSRRAVWSRKGMELGRPLPHLLSQHLLPVPVRQPFAAPHNSLYLCIVMYSMGGSPLPPATVHPAWDYLCTLDWLHGHAP